jgi:RimJ/RimL family protein N-acetyltransferase
MMSPPMIPTLISERLVLRPLAEADLDAYARMTADAAVMKYIGDGKVLNREEAWRSIAAMLGHWQLRGFGMWALTRRGEDEMIGRAGFMQPEGWPGFEIGWTLSPAVHGKGYATEAALCALKFAKEELGKREVISVIYPDNAPSIRVAEKIGEKYLRDWKRGDNVLRIYGMTLTPTLSQGRGSNP